MRAAIDAAGLGQTIARREPVPGGLPLVWNVPHRIDGKPIVRGTRISVELILSLLAQGAPYDEILDDYPELEQDDIRACLANAWAVIANDSLEAVEVAAS